MSKRSILALAACLALAGATAVQAEGGRLVRMEGWVVDEWCNKANANAEGKSCVLDCHGKGAALVFFSDGKVYHMSEQDQTKALDQVGKKVAVVGSLGDDGVLKVGSFGEPKKPKETPAQS
ncbi:MAG TPA: hypothetical protein VJS92_11865 [Candidatus Polarisedimenticolaceae bacterium]|nr:hypothetical protein [Candidatus Polarisedimenticolaceae bacterium]